MLCNVFLTRLICRQTVIDHHQFCSAHLEDETIAGRHEALLLLLHLAGLVAHRPLHLSGAVQYSWISTVRSYPIFASSS